MRSLWADLRTAARALRSTPGPSAAAVLALSLGVATAVALYTAFRTVSDDLPPVPHPERLGRLYAKDPAMPMGWRPLREGDVAPLVEQTGGRLVAALVDDRRIRPRPAEMYVPFAQAPYREAVLVVETRAAAGMTERLAGVPPEGGVRPKGWRRVDDEVSRARFLP